MKQVTGKENYENFKEQYDWYWKPSNIDILASPELLIKTRYGLRSAVWFWISKRCMRAADSGISDRNIDAVTKIINRGELGHRNADGSFTPPKDGPADKRRKNVTSIYKIIS